jgi:hypothetical protein
MSGHNATDVGELLQAWVGIRMEEVDDLVDEARSRVDALPDQPVMWSLVGRSLCCCAPSSWRSPT